MNTVRTGEVARTQLDNGLVVLTENIPTSISATLGIWIDVGSKHEAPQDAGISHFVEHMLFKGTPTHSAYDIADVIEGVGGDINGSTDKEQTCYSARVVDRHLDLAIDLVGDMLTNSVFSPDDLHIEKKVVIDEIKTYEDSPGDVIHDLFLRTAWNDHPLGRSTIGFEEVIRKADRAQLMAHRDRHYVPAGMMVTAAGHVDHHLVVTKAKQWFGGESPPRAECEWALPSVRNRCVFRARDTEQVYVCMGGDGISISHAEKYRLHMLDCILGGGMSSRLFQNIRERRGLVYNIGSFINAYMAGGAFGMYVIAGPESMPEVMRLLRDTCDDLRRDGVTPREFERAREYLKGSFALGLESSSFRMMRLMRSEQCHQRFVTPEEVIACYDAVTLEDVNAAARQYLDLDGYCMTALGPFRNNRSRVLRSISSGPWDEDVPIVDKPKGRRRAKATAAVSPSVEGATPAVLAADTAR